MLDGFGTFGQADAKPTPGIARQMAKKGDYVDLSALFDVLAVPNVCGADVMATSDFSFKPIALTIFDQSKDVLQQFRSSRKSARSARRGLQDQDIKVDRPLRRDPNYVPEFTNVPIWTTELAVAVDANEGQALETLKATGLYGSTDGKCCATSSNLCHTIQAT